MHYLCVFALLFHVLSIIPVSAPTPIEQLNASTTRLDVVQEADIDTINLYHGRPVTQKSAILFFHLVQLDLYRTTVRNGGDGRFREPTWQTGFKDMTIQVLPQPSRIMTFGDALYGLQQTLHTMLRPSGPGDGFCEQDWIVRRRIPGGGRLLLGTIKFRLRFAENSQ